MASITIAIENLYRVFGKYSAAEMFYCDCGCIDPKDVERLLSKPLRDLEKDDMSSYHGSALYTWGDLGHYKHFLPRFLELYSQKRKSLPFELWEISTKLEYAKWTEWPREEVHAIKEFVFYDWKELVNNLNSHIDLDDIVIYSKLIDEKELLNLWKMINSTNGLRNFINLFYHSGNKIMDQVKNSEGRIFEKEIYRKIQEPALLEAIEAAFFEFETKDSKYAEEASIVAQMIEQELKTIQTNK